MLGIVKMLDNPGALQRREAKEHRNGAVLGGFGFQCFG